jgi:alkylation response protein AidB-like acyl-CoA dehydrogenase
VHVGDDWNVMGQRATVSGTATFEDVPADPGLVVRYARAFEVPQQLGTRAQLAHAAIQTGIAGGALRDAREFVRTRARPFCLAGTTRSSSAASGTSRPTATARPRSSSGAAATRPSTAASSPSGCGP